MHPLPGPLMLTCAGGPTACRSTKTPHLMGHWAEACFLSRYPRRCLGPNPPDHQAGQRVPIPWQVAKALQAACCRWRQQQPLRLNPWGLHLVAAAAAAGVDC
jgi:hypothetical protein